jgi:drug/metabolite transporter (DMT)-like permease
MLALTAFGAVAGVLFGVGSVIVKAVTDRQKTERPEPAEVNAGHLVGCLLGLAIPALAPFAALPGLLVHLFNKDFKANMPGRGRRAAVGAVFLGLFASVGVTLLFAFSPPPPGGLTVWEAMLGILIAAVIGAVVGFLSESW